MGESAAARKAREAAEAEAEQAQDQAPEGGDAPGASTAPTDDGVPSSTDPSGGAPGADPGVLPADSGDPDEVVLWMATSTLPNPAGGTHRPGETFHATRSDPRARSNFARRHHDTGDDAPPEVESALDAPGV